MIKISNIIEVNKNIIPYVFKINLSEREYELKVNYNSLADVFTLNLYLNSNVIVYSAPLVLNQPVFSLFAEDNNLNINSNFPLEILIPLANNNKTEKITFENLGENVFIYAFNRERDFSE